MQNGEEQPQAPEPVHNDAILQRCVSEARVRGMCVFKNPRAMRRLFGLDKDALPDDVLASWREQHIFVEKAEEVPPEPPVSWSESFTSAAWWVVGSVTGPFVWTAQSAASISEYLGPIQQRLLLAAPADGTAAAETSMPTGSSDALDKEADGEASEGTNNKDAAKPKYLLKPEDFGLEEESDEDDAQQLPVIFVPALQLMAKSIVEEQQKASAIDSVFTTEEWTDLLLYRLNVRNPDVVTEHLLRVSGTLTPIVDPTSERSGFLFTIAPLESNEDAVLVLRFKHLLETVAKTVGRWESELSDLRDFGEVDEANQPRAAALESAIASNKLFAIELEKRHKRLTSPFAAAVTGGFNELGDVLRELLEQFPGQWPVTSAFEGNPGAGDP